LAAGVGIGCFTKLLNLEIEVIGIFQNVLVCHACLTLNTRNLTTDFLLCNQRQVVVVFAPWWRNPYLAASLEKLLHDGC
jgi:hypothetical protein